MWIVILLLFSVLRTTEPGRFLVDPVESGSFDREELNVLERGMANSEMVEGIF